MDYHKIAKTLIELKEQDEALRAALLKKGRLSNTYDPDMEALHNHNAKVLRQIMEKIGYPTRDKVGKEANSAAWLIIQHAIGQPAFMKKSAELLEKAVQENKANPIELAYLTDRIAIFEGQPQLYGTQFDWDEDGKISPNQLDDLAKVNQRRKVLGLPTLEKQTEIMRERVNRENQQAPTDLEERKQEYDEWRKAVGWIIR